MVRPPATPPEVLLADRGDDGDESARSPTESPPGSLPPTPEGSERDFAAVAEADAVAAAETAALAEADAAATFAAFSDLLEAWSAEVRAERLAGGPTAEAPEERGRKRPRDEV